MRRTAALGFAAVLVAALVCACGGSTHTAAPSGAGCAGDVKAPGTYPDLERLLPMGMIERSPDTLDSGRNCTPTALGTYASHGLTELRFAGATWEYGNGNGTVVAMLSRPAGDTAPLDVTWVEEFYTAGALAAKHTEDIKTTRPTMAGAGQVFRLEALNDLSLQTVVIWSATPYVHVVIVATTVEPSASRAAHDQRVATAVEVAAAVPIR
jgi:hypothetical protein